jgi:uncharacterized lipoprotein
MKNSLRSFLNPASGLIATAVSLLLAGCSALDYPDEASYQRAQQREALEVPPDLSRPESGAVPEIVAAEASAEDLDKFDKFKQLEQFDEYEQFRRWKEESKSDEKLDFEAFVAARKALREEGSSGAGVSIDSNFDQSRDIRISADADATWNYVDAALSAMGVEIVSRTPDEYRFELSLPEIRESSLLRPRADRFTLQIGRDQQDMLVALNDMTGKRVTTDTAGEFMNRLAGQIRLAKVRLELENRDRPQRAEVGTVRTTDTGHVELDLAEDSGRVFDRLDYVIDQIGFTVIERNRDERSFTVRYITDAQIPKERTGLAKLAFWKKDDKIPEGADVYHILVSDHSGGSTVRVLDSTSQPSETADTILELLRGQM